MPSNTPPEEIRLKDLLQTFWRFKFATVGFVLACTVATGVASFLVPKQYEASTIIAAATNNSNGPQGAIGSLTNNIAALAGISTPSDTKKVESIATLQSELLTERYIQENNLLPILYANAWDSANSRWKTTVKPKNMPTLWKANQFFRRSVRSVITDARTGLITVTITWQDPVIAATWANGLVRMTNDYERNVALAETERNITYLTQEAAKTDVVGIKQAIYSLLQSEFSNAMLAKGNIEYAFKIIDPAVTPERASYPNKIVWVAVAIFTSLSLAVLAIFCVVAWSKS